MTFEEIFDIWAPRGNAWADWVKPVVFAHMPRGWSKDDALLALPLPEVSALRPTNDTAMIIDLEGETSVLMGLALAQVGYRPVPLFNGVPKPEGSLASQACINVWPIMQNLWRGARMLRKLQLPAGAPPAFLLDSRRRRGTVSAENGVFDNRWISFPTDFPSARVLRERGVQRAVIVTADRAIPSEDIAHTLLRWQEGGIVVSLLELGVEAAPREIKITPPHLFRRAIHRFRELFGLKRNVLGGFGGTLFEASGG